MAVRTKSKKVVMPIELPDSSDNDIDNSMALVPVKSSSRAITKAASGMSSLSIAAPRKSAAKKKIASSQRAIINDIAQHQVTPAFGDIWCRLTNGAKTSNRTFDADDEKWDYVKYKNYIDMMYFVMRHGFHFKKIIDTYESIICSTLAEKETTLGWSTKLFVLVQHPSTNSCIILQLTDDEKMYKEYAVSNDINLLCSDILRNEKIHYQMTICSNRKRVITIQFPSIKERNFWRKCLSVGDLDD
jgi:hypothetical protein